MSDISLCECGHDHFAPLSQEREQWTTECPAYACGCKEFVARGSRRRPCDFCRQSGNMGAVRTRGVEWYYCENSDECYKGLLSKLAGAGLTLIRM